MTANEKNLSEQDWELLRIWEQLSDESKRKLLDRARILLVNQNMKDQEENHAATS